MGMLLIGIILIGIITELMLSPRLQWTKNKNLLLFYGKNRDYIILW